MKGMGVLVEEEYSLDGGRGGVVPFKDHQITQEQSFKVGNTAYLGNRNEPTWIQQNICIIS